MRSETPERSVRAGVVFLFDGNNTLPDYVNVITDLGAHLVCVIGSRRERSCRAITERIFPGALDVFEHVKRWGEAILRTDGATIPAPIKPDGTTRALGTTAIMTDSSKSRWSRC